LAICVDAKVVSSYHWHSPPRRFCRAWSFGERPAANSSGKRYTLTVGVQGRNWLNHVNPGTPVSILTSRFFGQALNLQSSYGSTANRRLEFSLRFGF
jgi:hypothetical protein